MGREIKFRAFIKSLKWMLPVERIYFDCKTVEVDLSDGNGDTSEYEFDEVELMQFTGIKDKNGKEIYEGDIAHYVVVSSNGIELIPCEVYFDMGAFYMKDTRMHGREDLLSEAEPDDIEIIGNIHEKLKLLEVAK